MSIYSKNQNYLHTTCLTKLVFIAAAHTENLKVEDVRKELGIHWYRPERLTLGLCVAVLRFRIAKTLFSVSFKEKDNSQNRTQVFRQINGTHSDERT